MIPFISLWWVNSQNKPKGKGKPNIGYWKARKMRKFGEKRKKQHLQNLYRTRMARIGLSSKQV